MVPNNNARSQRSKIVTIQSETWTKKKRPKSNMKMLTSVDDVKSRLLTLTVLAVDDTEAELEFMARSKAIAMISGSKVMSR